MYNSCRIWNIASEAVRKTKCGLVMFTHDISSTGEINSALNLMNYFNF